MKKSGINGFLVVAIVTAFLVLAGTVALTWFYVQEYFQFIFSIGPGTDCNSKGQSSFTFVFLRQFIDLFFGPGKEVIVGKCNKLYKIKLF